MRNTKLSPFLPAVITGLLALWVLAGLRVNFGGSPLDLRAFADLPALNGGRTKPFDSVARNALLTMSGRQTVRGPHGPLSAVEWLLDMSFQPGKADILPVLEINDPEVLGLMNIESSKKRRYSFNDLRPHLGAIEAQADRAAAIKTEDRNRFETAITNLYNQLILYQKLQNTLEASGTSHATHELETLEKRVPEILRQHAENPQGNTDFLRDVSFLLNKYQFMERAAGFDPFPISGETGLHWLSPGRAGLQRLSGGALHAGLMPLARMGDAYRATHIAGFNTAVRDMSDVSATISIRDSAHARRETRFNHAQPFYRALVIYLVAFLTMLLSWLIWRQPLHQTAMGLMSLAFIVHTAGLVARMILQGRPPVTNLYSSAIFVGWGAVLLGLVVERFHRNGLAAAVSAFIGFCTLIVAHHLSMQGDTLEMMRAVLDSNFWLATHVVTITIGYSSTFLSGFLAAAYLVRRLIIPGEDPARVSLERMAYGVVCFSAFFSFVGTILGGIWADQSWGRFWGWDPKENGALMIVLWNAFLLHVRWGRVTGERTLMVLTVFGNVITALSWFGVNMLGIGLHSYGFMDKAFLWLMAFCLSQAVVMSLGYLPAGVLRRRNAS